MPGYIKNADSWRQLATPYVKVGDTWRTVSQAYVKNQDSWRLWYSAGLVKVVTDTFNRSATSASLGTATSGQSWLNLRGSWRIQANQANSIDSASDYPVAIINTRIQDHFQSLNTTVGGVGLAFWAQDANNWWGAYPYYTTTPESYSYQTCLQVGTRQVCTCLTYQCVESPGSCSAPCNCQEVGGGGNTYNACVEDCEATCDFNYQVALGTWQNCVNKNSADTCGPVPVYSCDCSSCGSGGGGTTVCDETCPPCAVTGGGTTCGYSCPCGTYTTENYCVQQGTAIGTRTRYRAYIRLVKFSAGSISVVQDVEVVNSLDPITNLVAIQVETNNYTVNVRAFADTDLATQLGNSIQHVVSVGEVRGGKQGLMMAPSPDKQGNVADNYDMSTTVGAASITDDFNRTATTTGLGLTGGGKLWTNVRGNWKISAGTATTADPASAYPLAAVDLGSAFATAYVELLGTSSGLAFWVKDANNWWAAVPYVTSAPFSGQSCYTSCGQCCSQTCVPKYAFGQCCQECGGGGGGGISGPFSTATYNADTSSYQIQPFAICCTSCNVVIGETCTTTCSVCCGQTCVPVSGTRYTWAVKVIKSVGGTITTMVDQTITVTDNDANLPFTRLRVDTSESGLTVNGLNGSTVVGNTLTATSPTSADYGARYGVVFTPEAGLSFTLDNFTVDMK